MVCEVAHFGYNGAIVCILIHRRLSAPIRKSSPLHFYTYEHNHISFSTSSMSSSHFDRGHADLFASVKRA